MTVATKEVPNYFSLNERRREVFIKLVYMTALLDIDVAQELSENRMMFHAKDCEAVLRMGRDIGARQPYWMTDRMIVQKLYQLSLLSLRFNANGNYRSTVSPQQKLNSVDYLVDALVSDQRFVGVSPRAVTRVVVMQKSG